MLAETEDLNRMPENEAEVKGIIFNIQRYSIQDGPGIRTTVFLKGCPLRCAWCSNPESQSPEPEIAHLDSLCNNCGQCTDVCQPRAITVSEKSIKIDRNLCTNCGDCVSVCIPGALKIFGETIIAREVFRQVKRDEDFYREGGGGVTVSGGEPLLQADFVAALFKLCRNSGIHTCVETCGLAGIEAWQKVLPYTSLVLFDIKLSESAAHWQWTGASNEDIIRNLGIVSVSGVPVIIRIPMIPGINDFEEELRSIGRVIANTLEMPPRVNLLPYHRFGMGKYQQLDREYKLGELTTPKDEDIQKAKRLFESLGFDCEIEG
jgi:pyruvate formate lyase activating enzyme